MSDLVLPIIHLNGTSKEALIEQHCAAGSALRAALKALSEMAPNARDYYPAPGRFEQARAQHDRRAKTLRDLYDEIEAETIAIDEIGS